MSNFKNCLGINRNLNKKCLLKYIYYHREFHTSGVKFIHPKNVSEVKIPVPWGHIAGKWWGNKEVQPILAIHGGLDNANTFNELIPLLTTPSILCIDLPGHGFSSHIPHGITINFLDSLMQLRLLVKHHFKWERVFLLGHSFGSSLCFAYAGLFPFEVKWMINLECARFSITQQLSRLVEDTRNCYGLCDIPPLQRSKGFTWDAIVDYTYGGRQLWGILLTVKACETLAKRSVYKKNDKYFFTLDERLKYPVMGIPTDSAFLALAKRISCSSLSIFATGGLLNLPNLTEQFTLINPQLLELHISEMKKNLILRMSQFLVLIMYI